jgi:hypothetical protein
METSAEGVGMAVRKRNESEIPVGLTTDSHESALMENCQCFWVNVVSLSAGVGRKIANRV